MGADAIRSGGFSSACSECGGSERKLAQFWGAPEGMRGKSETSEEAKDSFSWSPHHRADLMMAALGEMAESCHRKSGAGLTQ